MQATLNTLKSSLEDPALLTINVWMIKIGRGSPPGVYRLREYGSEAKVVPKPGRKNAMVRGIGMDDGGITTE